MDKRTNEQTLKDRITARARWFVGALESVAQAFAVEHIAEVIPPSVMAKVKAAIRVAKGEK